jgi:hypothetical protein
MTTFDFNGDWTTELNLKILTVLQNDKFFKYSEDIKSKLVNGFVDLEIIKKTKIEKKPKNEQLSCITWIINNQEKILESLLEGLEQKIFPFYKELWGNKDENPDSYPKLNSELDLEKALGIYLIEINLESKDEVSYYRIYFNSCTDNEHGLVITLHKDRIIDFCGNGDVDNRKVFEDLGLNYDDWLKELTQKWN